MTDEITRYKPSEMAAAIAGLNITLSASDNGKVAQNGLLVAQTPRSSNITSNGTYDTTLNSSVTVNVSGGSNLGSKSISANGTYDPTNDSLDGYNSVTVAVTNSYAAGDEGKVVSSGALVAQTARSSEITENGTYDTTNNNSVTVNVSGGGGGGIIDLTYLPNSTAANVLASSDQIDARSNMPTGFIARSVVAPTATNELPVGYGYFVDLGNTNTDVTCYFVGNRPTIGSRGVLMAVAVSAGSATLNAPMVLLSGNNGNVVYFTSWGSSVDHIVSGVQGVDTHVYAMSIDNTAKKVRFYIDGVFNYECVFSTSGQYVGFGKCFIDSTAEDISVEMLYGGAVSGVESDATIIANMQTIMTKLGLST